MIIWMKNQKGKGKREEKNNCGGRDEEGPIVGETGGDEERSKLCLIYCDRWEMVGIEEEGLGAAAHAVNQLFVKPHLRRDEEHPDF